MICRSFDVEIYQVARIIMNDYGCSDDYYLREELRQRSTGNSLYSASYSIEVIL